MTTALVVGAGISGLACAASLHAAGIDVAVAERGRAVGGRMASRRLRDTGSACDGRTVDIGASYFTASTPMYQDVVQDWIDRDLARAWTDTFHVADSDGVLGVRTGPMRYAANAGLRSLLHDLASRLPQVSVQCEVSSVRSDPGGLVVDERVVDAVALCMPNAQAHRIIDASVMTAEVESALTAVTYEPVIAVTLVFAQQCWNDFDGMFINDDPVLTWVANDGSRRGDGAPVLVAHVNPVLAAHHLHDAPSVVPLVIATVSRIMSLGQLPVWTDAQRWTYAKPLAAHREAFHLQADSMLGLAGDAWADGPRVETAWLSGHLLGEQMAHLLGDSD